MATTALPKKRLKAIDRPFHPNVLRHARELAATYQVVMWEEDGEYFGRGVELPGTMNDGATPDECMRKTRESFVTTVAYMIEQGETPPPPATTNVRTEQVNVRLTANERLAIETAAKQNGYAGLSDYMRAAALQMKTKS